MKNKKIIKSIGAVLAVLLLTWYVSTYHYQLILIQGKSMQPTLHHLQIGLLDKHARTFSYEDVVAFHSPGVKGTCVKRVVGCPGDRIEITEARLYRNGAFVLTLNAETADLSLQLGEEEYFVLGDNYAKSKDSRFAEIGPVRQKEIFGRLLFPKTK